MKINYLILAVALMPLPGGFLTAQYTKPLPPDTSFVQRRYPIQSAIVTFENESDGRKSFVALCFDNYGEQEALETKSFRKSGSGFRQIHTLEIRNRGEFYLLDLEERTGKRFDTIPKRHADRPDFAALSPEMMGALGLIRNAPQEFLGKLCEVYVMHNSRLDIHAKYMVWNTLVLYSEINAAGVITTTRAVTIRENAPVPPSNFEVPLDIVVDEHQ